MMKDYESFYEAIDVRIDPRFIKNQNMLKNVMSAYGFFDGMDDPKSKWTIKKRDASVNIAWDYLKKGSVVVEKQRGIQKQVTIKKKGQRSITEYITTYDIKYDDKIYKKGSKVPKDAVYMPYKNINNRGQRVKQATVTIKFEGKWYKKGQFMPKKFRFDL